MMNILALAKQKDQINPSPEIQDDNLTKSKFNQVL
jgi:hypothetical protein